jgi:bifunctional DNase/RNase
MGNHRLVVLREMDSERYLPIWIGGFEADSLTAELQGLHRARPLTHDLLHRCLTQLGAQVKHVVVRDLRDDTFYATLVLDVNGQDVEVDSRSSDAINLAARAEAPIYVVDRVMDQASIMPEPEIVTEEPIESTEDETADELSAYRDFMEGLDLDFMDGEK